ncbi:MAG: sulfite exporter TauE/SafE family protein [Alphaproteobacteria bacterium]|nr:sulfite exporter TauE/SafE family protein [Alphaproteobacteria bacterium]
MLDPLHVVSGFAVGLLIGITGVGGGALMTPLLILAFGIHPSTAVGTDLLYAAATKSAGSLVHGWSRNIHWGAVVRLSCGSIPASALTLFTLWRLQLDSASQRDLLNAVLCLALLLTASALMFRDRIAAQYRHVLICLQGRSLTIATVFSGALLGVLVSLSSLGAGAVGMILLLLLYPEVPMARIVGSDIAHAVPLTVVAGAGHWVIGSVDWSLMGVLLIGSLPGIVLGSLTAARIPETALRVTLAVLLVLIAVQLGITELRAFGLLADGAL